MLIEVKSANFGRGVGGTPFFARKGVPPRELAVGKGVPPRELTVGTEVSFERRVNRYEGDGLSRRGFL